jgi:hypothetical protein
MNGAVAASARTESPNAKFRQASKSFAVFLAAAQENAALQRGWRDFRIAQ